MTEKKVYRDLLENEETSTNVCRELNTTKTMATVYIISSVVNFRA